jgi:nucleoside-diphosphate-sugar epimerase
MQGVDAVINLAAEHRDDVRPASRYDLVNVEGARSLVAAAEAAGVQTIVFTSTVAVYGLRRPEPDEEVGLEPFNDYGRTKALAEEVLRDWAAKDAGRSLSIVRPCVVFGEHNRGNVYNLLAQIASRRFVMVGDGTNCKSMAYVGNVARFLATLVDAGPGVRTLNYADKPDLPAGELVALVRKEFGMAPPRVRLPRALGMLLGHVADVVARVTRRSLPISAVRVEKFTAQTTVNTQRLAATGYQPTYTLDEGLRRMLASDFADRLGGRS